ncbi:MAG: hypothetical protein HY928_02170 [Elusimicrobia bacterium]|nr:hypothetical protein [Elusimicrobiota bacterium]
MRAGALALLALLPPAAQALDATDVRSIEGRELDTGETDLVRRMKAALAEDPARADALAARILRSSLASQLAPGTGPEEALADLRSWVLENPAAAAQLAVGFARDDADGTHVFEDSLYKQTARFLELSPDRNKGILGRLDGLGAASKAIKSDQGLSDDDRRRLMKELFEGRSSVDKDAKAGGPDGGGGRPSGAAASPVGDDGIYDRLSAANVTGYSPQVQTMQSELNRAAPPGTPRLIETGKLDHATLVHPGHSVRYDLGRLEAAAERDLAAARAAALGEALPPERVQDPAVQRDLQARAAGKSLPGGLARRSDALKKARAAFEAFTAAAEPAKKARGITPAMLKTLGAKRREAAVWLQVAALEDILQRLEALRGFADAALLRQVAGLPVDASEKRAYELGGAGLGAVLEKAIEDAGAAISFMKAGGPHLAKAQEYAAEARKQGRLLPERVALYRAAPGRLAAVLVPHPRWRTLLEDAAIRFLPSSSFAKTAAQRRKSVAQAWSDFKSLQALK